MWRLFKILFYLLIIAVIAVIGYAYVGDLSPTPVEVSEPVDLDAT